MKVPTPAAEVPAASQATPGACYSLPARGKADKSSPAAVASQPLLGLLRPSGIGWRESHPASVAAVSESFPATARAYVRASPDCLEPKRLASSEGVPVFSGGGPPSTAYPPVPCMDKPPSTLWGYCLSEILIGEFSSHLRGPAVLRTLAQNIIRPGACKEPPTHVRFRTPAYACGHT